MVITNGEKEKEREKGRTKEGKLQSLYIPVIRVFGRNLLRFPTDITARISPFAKVGADNVCVGFSQPFAATSEPDSQKDWERCAKDIKRRISAR